MSGFGNQPAIRAIGTAVPPGELTVDSWLRIADRITPAEVDRAVLRRLAERSGIERRRCVTSVDPEGGLFPAADAPEPGTERRMHAWSRWARELSLLAARDALASSGHAAAEITHVITASCTGFESPGIDAHLIESLGIDPRCRRTNVGFMGCHAAVNALACARDAVRSNLGAVALVACTEVSSAHFQRSARLDRLVANTLFADGAASAVVGPARPGDPLLSGTGSVLIPDTAGEMAWTVGDHGFEMTLGARVPDLLQARIRAWVEATLAPHGLGLGDIGGWAIHPGGPRVIDAVRDALGLDEAAAGPSRAVLRDHGNMSSATLLFIARALAERRVPRPWVGLAFGPGLAGELVLIR